VAASTIAATVSASWLETNISSAPARTVAMTTATAVAIAMAKRRRRRQVDGRPASRWASASPAADTDATIADVSSASCAP
jgi:hypothetical protein